MVVDARDESQGAAAPSRAEISSIAAHASCTASASVAAAPAAATLAGDGALTEIRALYEDDRLRVPPTVFNALRQAPDAITAQVLPQAGGD